MLNKKALLLRIRDVLKTYDQRFIKFKKIEYSQLPQYSPWPVRLLGIEEFKKRSKTKSEVLREFEIEKWKTLLKAYQQRSWKSFQEFRDFVDGQALTACYWKEKLFIVKERTVTQLQVDLISDVFSLFLPAPHVVELGCGYGGVLLDIAGRAHFKQTRFIGGELSLNGVRLVNSMAKQFKRPVVAYEFDFEYFNHKIIPQGSIIYTSFSLAYVSQTEKVIKDIIASVPKVAVHLEPVYVQQKNADLPSLMSRKYMEINDYSKNLLPALKKLEKNKEIEILVLTEPILGFNPFVPMSLIIWRPR